MEPSASDRPIRDATATRADGDHSMVDRLIDDINNRAETANPSLGVRFRRSITLRRVAVAVVVLAVGIAAWIWAPVLAVVYTAAVVLGVGAVAVPTPGRDVALRAPGSPRHTNDRAQDMDERRWSVPGIGPGPGNTSI